MLTNKLDCSLNVHYRVIGDMLMLHESVDFTVKLTYDVDIGEIDYFQCRCGLSTNCACHYNDTVKITGVQALIQLSMLIFFNIKTQ